MTAQEIKKALEVYNWHSDKFADPLFSWKRDMQPYETWHNERYLRQCYYNLEEKHDCGIVSDGAWEKISQFYEKFLKESVK